MSSIEKQRKRDTEVSTDVAKSCAETHDLRVTEHVEGERDGLAGDANGPSKLSSMPAKLQASGEPSRWAGLEEEGVRSLASILQDKDCLSLEQTVQLIVQVCDWLGDKVHGHVNPEAVLLCEKEGDVHEVLAVLQNSRNQQTDLSTDHAEVQREGARTARHTRRTVFRRTGT